MLIRKGTWIYMSMYRGLPKTVWFIYVNYVNSFKTGKDCFIQLFCDWLNTMVLFCLISVRDICLKICYSVMNYPWGISAAVCVISSWFHHTTLSRGGWVGRVIQQINTIKISLLFSLNTQISGFNQFNKWISYSTDSRL